MANLTFTERKKIEAIFKMQDGYVLDFNNVTFGEFFREQFNINIFDEKYNYYSGSKANRLRGLWQVESNKLVAKVLKELSHYWQTFFLEDRISEYEYEDIQFIDSVIKRLNSKDNFTENLGTPVNPVEDHVNILIQSVQSQDYLTLYESIKAAVLGNNQPVAALDRLHTYLIKHLRNICTQRGIEFPPDTPLHSLIGKYVNFLKDNKELQSEMSLCIMKTSISVLDKFNYVRNNQSFAHDNEILNYDESLLIFKHITVLIEFINSIERNKEYEIMANELQDDEEIHECEWDEDELPF